MRYRPPLVVRNSPATVSAEISEETAAALEAICKQYQVSKRYLTTMLVDEFVRQAQ